MPLAGLVGSIVARRSEERAAVVRANLEPVVGARPEPEMDALVRRAFVEYARYWALSARLTSPLVRRRTRGVTIRGREHYLAALERGGVVFALPHVGMWDAGGVVGLVEGFAVTTVAEEASTPRLTAWFERQRGRLGLTSCPLGPRTAPVLADVLSNGGVVALVSDRDIVGDGVIVPFFGQPTRMPAGPVVLALRTGATLVSAAVYLRPRGKIEIVIDAPLEISRQGRLRDDVVRLTADLAERYERIIRSAPEQWHVFQPIWPAACEAAVRRLEVADA
jgi:lauroyl/myristoyl acyltransferase